MQKKIIEHPEFNIIGLKVRTSNQKEFNPATAKIGPMIGRYWAENLAEKIPHRKNPGVRIVGYANYESDEHGEYDYYFGEEVSSLANIPDGMASLTIPAGRFIKITSDAGKMPDIIISTWQTIWEETKNQALGAQRRYQVDFEVYGQQANDPNNMIFDVCLGIK